ncbi:MAG TPA: alpha/beta hydrolase fold domain-containing protein [Candidatus Competibacter sp.]|nr:alpha/beta hydrolase fold domain-containing protein [Candidatus Competibacter sp.]
MKTSIMSHLLTRFLILSIILFISGCPAGQESNPTGFADRTQQFEKTSPLSSNTRGNRDDKLINRFKKFDQNGDGIISREELNRPRLFQRLDQNGDGSITLEEAKSHIQYKRSAGRNQRFDQNNDDSIMPEEAISYRNNRRQLAYNSINTETDIATDAATAWTPSRVTDARAYSRNNNARHFSASDSAFAQYPNIRYAEIPGVDPNLLSLDIYAPKTGQNHPIMIMVHGGGWQRGDKANANVVANKARYFTGMGYIFISMNYRLSPVFKHPTPVQDVARAIAWTDSNIGRYGGNAEHLYLMGHSAGAHLAALVATDQRYLQAAGKNLQLLKGVILLDGAGYDIPRLMREHNQPNIYVSAFSNDERIWKDASPITHIAAGKNIPPFLIFYTPRPRAQMLSENLRESLLRAGVTVRSKMINKSHKQINQEIGNPNDEATQIITDFLKNNST